jgi:hypothetical protein
MRGKTRGNAAAEQAGGSSDGGAEGHEDTPAERVGPVEIERLKKDDGRALILYRRTDERRP